MDPPRDQRFDNINLLRAFAALWVLAYHVIEHSRWDSFPTEGPLVTLRAGGFGVDLFFVISGFVISYSALILHRARGSGFAKEYWYRRLSRILPLYLLTLFLWIALVPNGFFAQGTRGWTWQLFTHFTFIHAFWTDTHGAIDGPNWSLAIEMQFYLMIAVLIRWIDRTPGWRIWLYGALISWAWRACMMVLYGHIDTYLLFVKTTQLPGTLDLFGAGIFLAKWTLDGGRRVSLKGILWIVASIATGYVTMQVLYWPRAEYWSFPDLVIFWRTPLAIFFFCILGAAVDLPQVLADRWLRPVNYLGEISYGIYLWHLFAIQYVVHVAGAKGIQALLEVTALTLLAASLSWRYVEKPIMQMAREPSRPPRTHDAVVSGSRNG